MSDIVFILGAGASCEGGAPQMHNFLDTADQLFRIGQAGTDVQVRAFDLVFRGVAALQQVYAKAIIDSDNLEDVFAAFEMATLFGSLPPLKAEEVRQLPAALRTLIVRTLEQTLIYQVVTNLGPTPATLVAPKPYDAFGGLLGQLHRDSGRSVSVMTFN